MVSLSNAQGGTKEGYVNSPGNLKTSLNAGNYYQSWAYLGVTGSNPQQNKSFIII